MSDLVTHVSQCLILKREMLAVAESCTGGWLSKVCTDLPGSSQWFERGYVTYSNQAKQDMLGVCAKTLATHGAVSRQTVEQMVQGVLCHSRADWGIAISGVAGPEGGSEINPVGSVWFAWMKKNHPVHTIKKQFHGERHVVREQSVEFALEEFYKLLK